MEIRKQVVALAILAVPGLAGAQVVIEEPDHLKCYDIRHISPTDPGTRTVRLKNQFRREKCEINSVPSRFCVETVKGLPGSGDDPRRGPAGHFLCYDIANTGCSQTMIAPQEALASDQFGDWRIQVMRPRQVCTSVEKIHPIPVDPSEP